MRDNFRDRFSHRGVDDYYSEEDDVFEDSDEYEYIEVEDNGEEFYVDEDDEYEYVEVEDEQQEYDEDEDFFEEGRFFHGNFPPPPPPMPFYIPPPVVPINNRQFGRNFPPPPPQIRPIFNPELREQLDEDQEDYGEIDIDDNGEEFYIEPAEEDGILEDSDEIIISAAPLSSMKSEASDKLLEEGMQQEAVVKNGKFIQFFITMLKWLLSLIVIIVMIGGCVMIVKSYFNTSSSSDSSSIKTREAPKGDFTWRMPFGRARTCLEEFYKSIGISDNYISAEDLLLKGTITINGSSDDVYCIKKRVENLVFIKIGIASGARAYSVSSSVFGINVNRLLDGGMSGRKKELSADNARIIRVITYFDDLIFARAFSRDYNSVRISDDISYEGEFDVDGIPCQRICLKDVDATEAKYYFDNKTSRLYKASYKNGNQLIEVIYSDYKSVDGDQVRPHARKIFVNSKPYAEIKFDFIVKRDGLIFPN